MKARKSVDGFNLSFLDVMACGLGAVLLILIVVKFNASSFDPTEEIKKLKEELAASEKQKDQLQKSIEDINDQIALETSIIEASKQHNETLKIQQQDLARAIEDKKAVVAEKENAVAAVAAKQAADPIKLKGTGEENYILGLKVEGKNVAILLDSSASMTEESMVAASLTSLDSDAEKQQRPKWQRALRVARWLLARVPKGSRVTMIEYNESAETLGASAASPMSTLTVQNINADLAKVVPENGTNLASALTKLMQVMPEVTNVYVITDGLPSKGPVNCASNGLVTGNCRERIFHSSIASINTGKVQVNTIMLPLDGDPHAPFQYWFWSHNSGGMLLTPAETWP